MTTSGHLDAGATSPGAGSTGESGLSSGSAGDDRTTVTVRFSALAAHVRTARLVAAAVARRTGVDEAVLDEVRLAVGEACSRAVELHRRSCPQEPVTMALTDNGISFTVEVIDQVVEALNPEDSFSSLADVSDLEHPALPAGVGLAVIDGLVEDLVVVASDHGTVVRMTWPLGLPEIDALVDLPVAT